MNYKGVLADTQSQSSSSSVLLGRCMCSLVPRLSANMGTNLGGCLSVVSTCITVVSRISAHGRLEFTANKRGGHFTQRSQ